GGVGRAGGAQVGGLDLVRGPPDGDLGEHVVGRASRALCRPLGGGRGDRVLGDVLGEVGDALGAGGQVGPPGRVGDQGGGDAGDPGERSVGGVAHPGVVQAPVDRGGGVGGGVDLPRGDGAGQRLHRVLPAGGDKG